jgi:hypothetical protein
MARGGNGLPKVLTGPAKPYPSTPCGQVILGTALWPFQGGLLSITPLGTPSRTPMSGFKLRDRHLFHSFESHVGRDADASSDS